MTVQEKTPERVAVRRVSHARDITRPGYIIKLVIMALVNALGVYGLLASWAQGSMGVLAFLVVALIVANYVYFSKRAIPLKYLYPGLLFLFVYQLYVMGNTAYVAFTNYGDGHNSTKSDSIEQILKTSDRRIEGSPTYPVAVVSQGADLGFAVVRGGEIQLGTMDEPLAPVEGELDGDRVTAVDGWDVLTIGDIQQRQNEVLGLRVSLSEDPTEGWLRTD
ncbi:MAG: hypothetical protein LC667_20560, partial [Thioalkalivibrio sp.]|nr:hypothetical protein [Thioalkalivibrio sp.]